MTAGGPAVPARPLRHRLLALVVVLLVGGLVTAAAPAPGERVDEAGVRSFFVPVAAAPTGDERIRLDVDLYLPPVTPAPAVLLAHGFGQSKADLATQATRLQDDGYVVLAYTARGFGRSGGEIGLDSLDGEVPDARALVDVLAGMPEVTEADGDPVVGVVGGSYGGALALMLAATDSRVDTVVAAITWHDLADALLPPSAGTVDGVRSTRRDVKTGWAARLFSAGLVGASTPCGRFSRLFCELYRTVVTGGTPSEEELALLARSSPATVLDGMRAPTLLLQGLRDNLFGLDQADANAAQIARAGAPVQVRWFDGGHDGGGTAGTDRVVDAWLADHLMSRTRTGEEFVFSVPASATSFRESRTAATYPGLDGDAARSIVLAGEERTVVNPPGGEPSSATGLPGLGTDGRLGSTVSGLLAQGNPPAEQATFASAPLKEPVLLTGSATVPVRVDPATGSPDGGAVLYAQLSARTGDAVRALPGGVAPVRVDLPARGAVIDVRLPATVWGLAPGDRLVLTLRTSDSQYAGSAEPAAYRVALAGPIVLPVVTPTAADRSAGLPAPGVLAGIAATLLVGAALILAAFLRGRRRRGLPVGPAEQPSPAVEGPPLVIRGLTKRFRSGFLAVDDVSFTVERGQVLGLLGENGAGKTTTLRMVAGLIRPDAGSVESFGGPVGPGAPVLTRFGCFIEGPGFLSHLSGRRNLELYWASTGRPRREARFDEALAVADLGGAIGKPVRGYSQGMRQRLAIAQAMLGMPDLLVLDEPANGLDPPQITALRGVLQRYAEAGRTVIVSSHLLAEVERTCSHVVVMSHGRVVAAGPVEAIAGDASELVVAVTDVGAALVAVRALRVELAEEHGATEVRVLPGDRPVQAVVEALVAAGVGVTAVRRGRHLEEAFLALIGATEPSA